MLVPATLKIYNASAGSGKTFFLVKNYLTLLFKSPHDDEFKRVLALTFTNKATEEMKKKILQCIQEFSIQKISKEYSHFFFYFIKNLKLTKDQLSKRAKKILSSILDDYSYFSISTIDKFTYRTIRSFSLNKNLDLEMDTNRFLWEIVDNLLFKLKNSEKWAHILIQFSLEKLREGKNWDIRNELFKIAHLIIDENSFFPMKKIKKKSLSDWIKLKKTLLKRTKKFEKICNKQGKKFFNFLKKKSIHKNSFPYKDLPKFFKKLRTNNLILNPFKSRIEKALFINKKIYKNTLIIDQKNKIKKYTKYILLLYKKTKSLYQDNISIYLLDKLFLKNLNLLSIIQEIEKEFYYLKEEKKIILNAEINKILHERIIKDPFPIIYEKMLSQYKHYFIDEFQDTSLLQWKNLKILVENALSENGSAMIVGDPKQSIYRFRGGDVKHFMHLISDDSKYYHKKIVNIETNFRSYEEIVKFNNSLYQHVNEFFHSNTIYKDIYKKYKQKVFKKPGGYVELNFVYKKTNNYKQYIYSKIENKIKKLLKQKYQLSDIAILVRNNEEVNFLSEKFMENGFMVHTSGSLLIKNHFEIKIIVHFFYIFLKPACLKNRADLILLLLQNKIIFTKKKNHDFIINTLFLPLDIFFKKIFLKKSFNFKKFYYNQSIYKIAENIINGLNLLNKYNTSSIYSFLDFIHRSIKIIGNSIVDFLEYWKYKKEKESIIISDKMDAIRLMTIHKSKGLQFPVVILPFTDWNAFFKKKEGAWINVSPHLYHGLDTLYLDIEPYFKYIKDNNILKFYNQYLSKIKFDNINLLYVATTRPVEKLIIFSKKVNNQSISIYIKNFLKKKKLWNDKILQYFFGKDEISFQK